MKLCIRLPALLLVATVLASGAAEPVRPNILFLLADDLGYGDLGSHGGARVKTPHLDALAGSGTKFNRYYAASAVCSPTRASLLTGRYPLHWGITRTFSDAAEHLPRAAITLPKILRQAGYTTAHVGKWDLGGLHRAHLARRSAAPPGPREHGFDHYFSRIEVMDSRGLPTGPGALDRDGAGQMVRDDALVELTPGQLADVEADESVRLLDQFAAAGQPFFLNVWFDTSRPAAEPTAAGQLTPPAPDAAGAELLYRSRIARLDASVGRIIAKLDELKLRERTLVLFSSDNGPTGLGSAGVFRGGKGTLYEGGLRVPFTVSWPGVVKGGRTVEVFMHSTDVLPTVCGAARIGLPKELELDGQNFFPFLLGRTAAPTRPATFWQLDAGPDFQRERREPEPYATEVILKDRWKLLCRNGEPLALYNLYLEVNERTDMLNQHDYRQRVVPGLLETLNAWLAEPRVTWTDRK